MITEQIIKQYYAAWLNNDEKAARALLADNLDFRAPGASYNKAYTFMLACWPLAAQFNDMHFLQEVYGPTSAWVAYRSGDFVVGEFIRIRSRKIASIYVTMNPTLSEAHSNLGELTSGT